jgi:hypothetical protein
MLGCNIVQFRASLTSWRNILIVSTGPKTKPSKKPAETGINVSSCLAYSLTLKMKAIHCSKILGFLQIKWGFMPENHIPHSHHHENLKSNRTLINSDNAMIIIKTLCGLRAHTFGNILPACEIPIGPSAYQEHSTVIWAFNSLLIRNKNFILSVVKNKSQNSGSGRVDTLRFKT